jgi:hypothetical protein
MKFLTHGLIIKRFVLCALIYTMFNTGWFCGFFFQEVMRVANKGTVKIHVNQ